MDEKLQILLTADSTNAISNINATKTQLDKLSASVSKTTATTQKFGDALDRSGRQTQIALRSVGEVGALAGLDRSFIQSALSAGMLSDAIGDIGGALSMVNPVMIGLAAAGAGLAFVFTKYQEEQKAIAEAIKQTLKPADDLRVALDGINKPASGLATALQNALGVSSALADDFARLATESDAFKARLVELEEVTRKAAQAQLDYAKAAQQAAVDANIVQEFALETEAIYQWSAAAEQAKWKAYELYWQKKQLIDQAAQEVAAMRGAAAVEQRNAAIKAQLAGQEQYWIKQNTQEWNTAQDSARKYADALRSVQSAQENLMRGLVEKAFTPSVVSEEDMKIAKAGGATKSNWDETRRRFEAFGKGTPITAYGEQFKKTFESLKMSADDAARAFKDFSLFANPKNLNLVDWGAFAQDIGQQLLGLVGKANLMKEGFARAWASLSNDQRKALRELGVESAGDAKKVLMGTSDNLMTPFNDKEQIKKFQATGAGVVSNLKSGMLDKETMKTFLEAPQTLLQNMLGWFALPDSIKAMIDSGAQVVNNIAQGIRDNSSVLSAALIQAVLKALKDAEGAAGGNNGKPPPPPPPFGRAGVRMANGGAGIAYAGQTFIADAGEAFWFSGVPARSQFPGGNTIVNLTYAPGISLGTRAEATSVLAPMIVAAVKDAQKRRAL